MQEDTSVKSEVLLGVLINPVTLGRNDSRSVFIGQLMKIIVASNCPEVFLSKIVEDVIKTDPRTAIGVFRHYRTVDSRLRIAERSAGRL